MANPFSDFLGGVGRQIGQEASQVAHAPLAQALKGIAPVVGQLLWKQPGKSIIPTAAKSQTPAARANESAGTTLADTAAGDTTTLDPFAALNKLIPDPLATQLFYHQTVAPLIQHQVDQMTQYGDLLKHSGGGNAGLAGLNQQLGNQYSALAAALGAQTAQAPAVDALMQNLNSAKSQQTDIYSLIKSLIAAQQQPAGDLAQILAAAGLGAS